MGEMPLYDFRCPRCNLEFEVSRPMSRATEPAFCPVDSAECERIITMPATMIRTRGGGDEPSVGPAQPPQQRTWSHFGHSHGLGATSHGHPNFPKAGDQPAP